MFSIPVHVEIVLSLFYLASSLSSSSLVLSLAVIVSHSTVRYQVFNSPVFVPVAILQSRTSLYVNVGNRLLILLLCPFL